MKKIQRVEIMFEFLRVLLGIIIAFALCLVIIVLMSEKGGAMDAIKNFAIGPFMSKRRFGQVMSRYIPYMLTGCGMCFIYACGRFNLIGEGIINIAPILPLFIMFKTPLMTSLPKVVNLAIIVILCAAVGGAIAMVPAIGRERLGANEMVTSIIMQFMLWHLSMWLLKGNLADRSQSFLTSPPFPDNMRFARYWGDTNFHEGIWVAIAGVIVACILFYRTRIGAKIRLCGSNLSFAEYSGINARKSMYMGQLLGGIFAGVAAAVDCFGLYNSYYYQGLTNLGMDGLIVAVMARKHPIFVPLTAFVLAYIRIAAAVLNANTNIPIELVTILQAVIVLFVAAEHFLHGPKERIIFKLSREAEAEKKEAAQHA